MISSNVFKKLLSSAERNNNTSLKKMLNRRPKKTNPYMDVVNTAMPQLTQAPRSGSGFTNAAYRGVAKQIQNMQSQAPAPQPAPQAPPQPAPQQEFTPEQMQAFAGKAMRMMMQEGGEATQAVPQTSMAPEPQQQEEQGPVGFIEKPTAATTPQETVADDVPMDVPEGSFIINGPAVEFAGSKDVRRMLEDAVEEAKRQGIDIGATDSTMSNEDYVALLVSKGEVVVPPTLAKIIGYDKLNKINDRGKEEVARRAQEAEQQEPLPAMQGGYIRMRDGGGVVSKT